MMMSGAPRIEPRAAMRAAASTREILADRQLGAARTAQNGVRVERLGRPRSQVVICQRIMTFLARVISAAATKPDRDYVERAMIVRAARRSVDLHTMNRRTACWIHLIAIGDRSHAYIS